MVDGYSYTYSRRRETDTSNTSLQYSSHSGSHLISSSNQNYHPSFSSTLLDAIYRSIDQPEEEEVVVCREGESASMRRKVQGYSSGGGSGADTRGVFRSEEEMANFQRACMIEKWMEKKAAEKVVVVRRKSAADLQVKKPRKDRENSTSSSSDSSCGGGGDFFSSSEAESFPVQRPKPIRTGFEKEKIEKDHRDSGSNSEFLSRERRGFGGDTEQKPKSEGGFLKTKSRALKIYGDLKKVKQPISPGGKLAGFLNSLFAGGNLKKHKTAANGDDSPSLKSANASTCSTASSFSRSCLSKTPSSGGKPSNAAKRSVRFSPVSVIVDDRVNNNYSKKQTSKSAAATVNNNNNNNNVNTIRNVINEELMVHVMDKNRRVEDVARDLLRNYHRKNQVGCEFDLSFDHLKKSHVKNNQVLDRDDIDRYDEEEDDAASCASSDLFELDNLSAIGMERYRQELPVYETTHLGIPMA